MDKNKISIFLIFLLFIPLIFVLPTIALGQDSSEDNLVDYTIEISALPTNVVINEILFDDNIDGDYGEFIEIYNPTATSINMSGYIITDLDPTHSTEGVYEFPLGTIIPSRGFIVVLKNISVEQLIQPDDVANDSLVQLFETINGPGDYFSPLVRNLTKISGNFDIDLANSKDEVYLNDSNGNLIDSVRYGDPPLSVDTLFELKTADCGSGAWENYTLERVWTSTTANWDVNGTGWAVKHNPTPGKLNGTVPSYSGEDPFGGGIPDTVVINEVYFDTIYDTGNTQINQFIEIFNPTDRNFNLTGWEIETNGGTWEFNKSKWADELGDSDILLIWPDNNQTEVDVAGNWPWDPKDDIGSWWEFWNNVDDMETWYSGDDFTHPESDTYKNHALIGPGSDLNLASSGDYVVLRDIDGNVIDAVAWGSGYTLPIDAAAVIGTQNVGSDHGIGTNESLERIWQTHLPVCDFLSGPGVYHLPTPGKKIGTVPDEIEEGSEQTWDDLTAGSFSRGSEGMGIEVSGTLDNGTRIDVAKYTDNPKDHEPEGLLNNSEEVAFWHIQANNTVDPMQICIYIPDSMDINLSTLELYEWDFATEEWVKLYTTQTQTSNNNTKVCATTELNTTISNQKWIGVFASSTGGGGDIPGFEWIYLFITISLISLVYVWLTRKKIVRN